MKLDAVVRNHNALLEMERYVDEAAKSYSVLATRTEAAPCYRPESGATSFDLKYGQGFYGWIGDVRITGRPLKPAQFLTEGHYR